MSTQHIGQGKKLNSKPIISIVLPIYNVEQYLSKCIESIIRQGYEDYELILVDDGSTDKSGAICDDYARLNKKIIVTHKENRGVSSARNLGIEIASGEYLWFIDPDDFITDNCLEILINQLIDENLDLITFPFNIIGTDGNITHTHRLLPDHILSGSELLQSYKLDQAPWTNISKLSIWKKHNIRFLEGVIIAEDLDVTLRMRSFVRRAKIVNRNIHPYNYVQREGSAMHRTNSLEHTKRSIQSFILIQDKWTQTFNLDSKDKKSYDYLVWWRGLNILKSNAISILFHSRIPYKGKKKLSKILEHEKMFLDNHRGKMELQKESLHQFLFYRIIATCPILFNILLKIQYIKSKLHAR